MEVSIKTFCNVTIPLCYEMNCGIDYFFILLFYKVTLQCLVIELLYLYYCKNMNWPF